MQSINSETRTRTQDNSRTVSAIISFPLYLFGTVGFNVCMLIVRKEVY
jgi:hypothetical protein